VQGFASVLNPAPLDDALAGYIAGALHGAVVLCAYMSNGTVTKAQFLQLCEQAYDGISPEELALMRRAIEGDVHFSGGMQ
jgi:hypothetical protein